MLDSTIRLHRCQTLKCRVRTPAIVRKEVHLGTSFGFRILRGQTGSVQNPGVSKVDEITSDCSIGLRAVQNVATVHIAMMDTSTGSEPEGPDDVPHDLDPAPHAKSGLSGVIQSPGERVRTGHEESGKLQPARVGRANCDPGIQSSIVDGPQRPDETRLNILGCIFVE
jgi:hypothetical protein